MTERPLTRLDFYLASYFDQRPALALTAAGPGLDLVEAVKIRYLATEHVFAAMPPRVESLRSFFGPPSFEDHTVLRYPLILWPQHNFDFGLQDGELVVLEEFVRASRVPELQPIERSVASASVTVGLHTAEDVAAMLGLPDSDHSWYPDQTWTYALPSSERFVIDLFYGLVYHTAVEQSASRSA